LCERFRPDLAVIADASHEAELRERLANARLTTRVESGAAALTEAASGAHCDTVIAAIVGAAGLESTLAAARAGKRLLLANKEAVVMAGPLLLAALREGGGELLPIDSEHNAIFQCLPAARAGLDGAGVRRILLTASGGPFRGRARAELADVTVEETLRHPTWSMGPKITVDSATLANKGLELIEAHWLFGLPYERIEVVVHPTSVVHALVRLRDGALLAHVGLPDMRVPISYALTYPERAATPVEPLDLEGLTLSFEAVDDDAFPLVALARAAGERGGTGPCAFNAANEVAVGAFLEGRLRFDEIAEVVAETLGAVDGAAARDLEDLVDADGEARRLATRRLQPA